MASDQVLEFKQNGPRDSEADPEAKPFLQFSLPETNPNGFIDFLGNDWNQTVSEAAIRTAIERINEIPTQFSKDGETITTKYRLASIFSLPRALVFFFTARNNRGYRMPYYVMPWSSLLAPFRAYDFAIRGVLIDDHRAAIKLELEAQNAALQGGDADFEFVLCTNSPLIQLRKRD